MRNTDNESLCWKNRTNKYGHAQLQFLFLEIITCSMAMLNLFSSICILFLCCLYKVHGCTTFAVGKDATIDGSTMGTHTNDGGGTTDGRLIKIDAQDYPSGSLRPIYGSPEDYPRYVRIISQCFQCI